MSMFRTEVSFLPEDKQNEFLFIGRWTSDDLVPPILKVTTQWLHPQRMTSALARYADDLAHIAAHDVRRWIEDTEVFPVWLFPGDGPRLLTAFTEVLGHTEDLSELNIRREADGRGISFSFTYWDFVSLDPKVVLGCLNSTPKWYPQSQDTGYSPARTRHEKQLAERIKLQYSQPIEPKVPDFEDWQVQKLFEVFGGRQIVRVHRTSRLSLTGEKTHRGTERFLGSLVFVRTDYLKIEGQTWKLHTRGLKQQDMRPNR